MRFFVSYEIPLRYFLWHIHRRRWREGPQRPHSSARKSSDGYCSSALTACWAMRLPRGPFLTRLIFKPFLSQLHLWGWPWCLADRHRFGQTWKYCPSEEVRFFNGCPPLFFYKKVPLNVTRYGVIPNSARRDS